MLLTETVSSVFYMESVVLEICGSADVLHIVESVQTSDWPSQPLTEDLHLQKFSALDVAHKDLSFESHSRLDLSLQQEVTKHSEMIYSWILLCCYQNLVYTELIIRKIEIDWIAKTHSLFLDCNSQL